MHKPLENKRLLVTGACGTVGRELIGQLLENYRIGELVGVDINETASCSWTRPIMVSRMPAFI